MHERAQSSRFDGRLQGMGELINLNKYRKLKARKEKERLAQQNRLKQGVSAGDRSLREKKKELEKKRLEGHKLDSDES